MIYVVFNLENGRRKIGRSSHEDFLDRLIRAGVGAAEIEVEYIFDVVGDSTTDSQAEAALHHVFSPFCVRRRGEVGREWFRLEDEHLLTMCYRMPFLRLRPREQWPARLLRRQLWARRPVVTAPPRPTRSMEEDLGALRSLRARGWSLSRIGAAVGVSKQSVHHWLHGNKLPNATSRDRIARIDPGGDHGS